MKALGWDKFYRRHTGKEITVDFHSVRLASEYKETDFDAVGILFTGDALGAFPRGTRIEKCNTEHQDSFPDGTPGTVYSSLLNPVEDSPAKYVYYVLFDPNPVPCLIQGHRIKEIS